MLRRSNVCLRYLGAGTRFGGRPASDGLLKASALRHAGLGSFRRNAYSAAKAHLFDAEDEFSEPADSRPRFKRVQSNRGGSYRDGPQRDGSQWESFRHERLSETMKFTRNQRKRERREVRGDSEEVALLMELSKIRGLPTGINSTVVSKEVQWLNDPKQFANRIAALLDSGKVSLAVAMIRKAETTRMECSAAWNRLLSYCFKQGAPLAAFKFYNDMKKRGRSPTDRTYTIMLRGLCLRSRQTGVKPVELAYKIYQQLLAKSSDTVASLYHHHAMLEVCGTYHDMDTLWNVIGDLPEHGANKPNAQTFTVILLALRNSFDNEIESLPEDKMEMRKEKRENLILDAKRIWADIISQWRKGQLDIDNHLVSAMVTVLSDPLDELNTYNVLALFNQTMGIPIFIAKPKDLSMEGSAQGKWEAAVRSSKERPNYTPWQSLDSESGAPSVKELTPEDGIELSLEEELPVEEDNIDEKKEENWVDDLEGVFDPVNEVKKANSEEGPRLLAPDNMVLNHILTVCRIVTRGTAAGKRYWNLFTLDQEGYKVQPDEGNFHEYLRLLRISRSSHTAGEVIAQQMVPTGLVEGKTFHIAMSSCLRDRMNPNVLINAQTLLKLMKENLPLPDPRALKSFIDLSAALTENPQWLLGLRGLEDIDSTTTNFTMMGRNLRWGLSKAVIESLEPHINRLYESMDKQIDEPLLYSKQPPADVVNGFIALEFMVKVREMLDKLLGSEYKDVITKSDREWISPLAVKLRKFSKPEVASKLQKARLRPLPHHYNDLLNQTKSD